MTYKRKYNLRVEYGEPETIYSIDRSEPDPNWEYIDKAGHTHKYVNGKVPTLHWVQTEDVWFDSDGMEWGPEGETRCIQCEEPVEPGTRQGSGIHHIYGPAQWYLNEEPISEEEGEKLYQEMLEEYYERKGK